MANDELKPRDILLVTADAVKYNGKISFMFMINADPERKLNMPNAYGLVWKLDDDSYSFNVFEGGKGLLVGGGFTKHDSPDWEKEMADAIPSCTLLIDIDLMPWWQEMAKRTGLSFRSHHVTGILQSS